MFLYLWRSWQLTLGDIDYYFYMSIFIVFDRFGKPRVAFFYVLNLSTLPSSIVFYQLTLFHLEKVLVLSKFALQLVFII